MGSGSRQTSEHRLYRLGARDYDPRVGDDGNWSEQPTVRSDDDELDGGPRVRVICEGETDTYALPPAGEVVIGRSVNAHVPINHASVSRSHAVLHIGDTLEIEDLGSQNGTRAGGRRLQANERAPVEPYEVIDVGSALVIIEADSSPRAERGAGAYPQPPEGVVVRDPAMRRIFALLERVAGSELSVLLLGETGSGKEVIAEHLHRASGRSGSPLLKLNCATLGGELLESELFGHEAGSFTGAKAKKIGLLETASGGTVFLDEIGEMPASTQAKLLRALEDRVITPVGGTKPRPIDVRFVSATNRDLLAEVRDGGFRKDLYYRLNGLSVRVPPLRERPTEIVPLAEFLAETFAGKAGREVPRLSEDVQHRLRAHTWPGNVRELRNVVERAMALADDVIDLEHLPLEEMELAASELSSHGGGGAVGRSGRRSAAGSAGRLGKEIDNLERERIIRALDACGGNRTHAAAELGISRSTLIRRLRAYGISESSD